MQQAAQEISITSGVNESRFLEHLKTMFSTSTTVLAEAIQNARRAGASSVELDFNDETASLVISDNGCGISDFRALITVAESGWSEETIATDKPFGIGFFSVSFAAEQVTVESRGRQITFSSGDLIAKRNIAVEPSSFIGGTRLTLHGCKLGAEQIGKSIRDYAKGFAIPVFWRGEYLPRPHAAGNLNGANTPVGFISIRGIHTADQLEYESHGIVYCQGLPVTVEGFDDRTYGRDTRPIVHVDHHQYQPRMPDRDALIDGKKAGNDFRREIRALCLAHMEAQKQVISAAEFVSTYWEVAKKYDALEMMNNIPVLPKSVLFFVGDYPVKSGFGNEFMHPSKAEVTREEIESGAFVLCQGLDYEDGGNEFAKYLYAQEKEWLFVSDVPEGHWARSHILDLDEASLNISCKVVAEEDFSGCYASGKIKLVDKLVIVLNGQPLEIKEPVALGSDNWSGTMVFMVPKGSGSASHVLLQASDYLDEYDTYMATDNSLDCEAFDNLVAILAGESKIETLKKCLLSANADNKTNLRESTFTVSIDGEGKISVEEV